MDDETVGGIRSYLIDDVENCNEAQVIVDLGNVEYVSSTFLGLMISLHKKLIASGRGLEIRNLRPTVYEVFVVCSLDKFLNLSPAAYDPSRYDQTLRP